MASQKPIISFDDCAFKPKRENLAKFLTNYLIEEKEGFVLNLNGSWGTGKTHFLQSWKTLISDAHPVVYINAWKTDFADDPMLVVVNSIVQFFKEASGGQTFNQERKIINTAFQLSRPAIKAAAGLAGALVGIGEVASGTTDKALGLLHASLTDSSKSYFDDYKQKQDALDQFEKVIEEWVDCYMDHPKVDKKYPIMVFVDELDRCRPTYAIELLETVKHMFNLNNFVFVVATDTEQLQHSIKAVYGQDFDSKSYLTRFFDRTFQLPEPSLLEFLNAKKYFEVTSPFENNYIYPLDTQSENNLHEMIAELSFAYGLTLRDVDKLCAKLNACFRWMNQHENSYILNLVCLIHMIISHQYARNDYDELPNYNTGVKDYKWTDVHVKWMDFNPVDGRPSKLNDIEKISFIQLKCVDEFMKLKSASRVIPESIVKRIFDNESNYQWVMNWSSRVRERRHGDHISYDMLKDLVEMSVSFSD